VKKSYEQWKIGGLLYERLLAKVKEYSRSRRLDGEARKGKQAIDLNAFQDAAAWGDDSQKQEHDEDSLNVVGKTKCYKCGSTGHITPNCPKGKGKGKDGKGKGKGKDGPKGKGKGKGGKGVCAICGDPGHWKNECPQNPEKGRRKDL